MKYYYKPHNVYAYNVSLFGACNWVTSSDFNLVLKTYKRFSLFICFGVNCCKVLADNVSVQNHIHLYSYHFIISPSPASMINRTSCNTVYSVVGARIGIFPTLSDSFLADLSYILRIKHIKSIKLQSIVGAFIIVHIILLHFQSAAAT